MEVYIIDVDRLIRYLHLIVPISANLFSHFLLSRVLEKLLHVASLSVKDLNSSYVLRVSPDIKRAIRGGMRAFHLILLRWGARPGVLCGAEVIGCAVAVNVVRIPATVSRISTHINPMLIKRLSHLLCDWLLQVCLILLQHLGCIDVLGVRRLDILSALEVRATPRFAPYSSGLLRL